MSAVQRGVVRAVEWMTGQRRLRRIYTDYLSDGAQGSNFWAEMLDRAHIQIACNAEGLTAIPRRGPVVVVANHPYGLVDGFALCWLMSQVRPDFRILINAVLVQTPQAREHMLSVDFSDTRAARATNVASRQAANRHLAAGGAVAVFPAGGVSTSPDRLGRLPAVDAPWQPFAAQMLQRADCPVVPVHFAGQNSRAFQIASHVSQTLRVSLLAHEITRRFGSRIEVTVGMPIPYRCLQPLGGRQAIAAELQRRTYALGDADAAVVVAPAVPNGPPPLSPLSPTAR